MYTITQKKAKQNKFQRNYRATQTCPQKKAKCNDNQRNYRLKNFKYTGPEKKAKHYEYQRNYSASNISIELLIKKFHKIVSQGPL